MRSSSSTTRISIPVMRPSVRDVRELLPRADRRRGLLGPGPFYRRCVARNSDVRRWRPKVLLIAAAVLAGCAACSSGASGRASSSTSAPRAPATTPSCNGSGAATTAGGSGGVDVAVPGDIPDSQAFVSYASRGGYTIEVPEGWPRTDAPNHEHWQSKLIAVDVRVVDRKSAPTTASVRADEMPAIERSTRCATVGNVSSVLRKSGPAIRVVYRAESDPEPVTGKVVLDDVERYDFWHAGKELVVTLSAPRGSDNVDVWRRITDSVKWQ